MLGSALCAATALTNGHIHVIGVNHKQVQGSIMELVRKNGPLTASVERAPSDSGVKPDGLISVG